MGAFAENMKSLGLGYALDCLKADIEYKVSVYNFEQESKRIAKKLEKREAEKKAEIEQAEAEGREPDTNLSSYLKRTFIGTPAQQPINSEAAQAPEIKNEQVATTDSKELPAIKVTEIPITTLTDKQIDENINQCITITGLDPNETKTMVLSLMYFTVYITPEQFYKKIDVSTDMKLINALCYGLTGVVFNPSYDSPKLTTEIVGKMKRVIEFEKLCGTITGIAFDEIYKKINELKIDDDTTVEEKKAIVPIIFHTTENPIPLQPINTPINDDELKKLKAEFGDLLNGYNYQFNKIFDLYELAILRDNGYVDAYTIDPGHAFYQGVSIVQNAMGTVIPFPIKYKDIAAKILANRNNILNLDQKEWNKINSKILKDYRIYQFFDLSTLNSQQIGDIKENLSKLFTIHWGCDGLPAMPRMRVKKFKNKNNFTLVCDNKVKIVALQGFEAFQMNMEITVTDGNKVKVTTDTEEFEGTI